MPNRGLDDLQKRAADLLLSGWKITTISNYLEISRVTIYNWQKTSDWQDYIKEQSGEALSARTHRIQRILDLALEQIEASLTDPEIVPLKRAEIALKWLALVMQNLGDSSFKLMPEPAKRVLDGATVKMIREQVYGIYDYDPEVPNEPTKILEPGLDGISRNEAESL